MKRNQTEEGREKRKMRLHEPLEGDRSKVPSRYPGAGVKFRHKL